MLLRFHVALLRMTCSVKLPTTRMIRTAQSQSFPASMYIPIQSCGKHFIDREQPRSKAARRLSTCLRGLDYLLLRLSRRH